MGTDSRPLDELFYVLSNRIRRQLVVFLADCDGESVGWDRTIAAMDERLTSLDRESLRIRLYHNHVPKLVATDVIGFDDGTRRIRSGPRFGEASDHVVGS